MSDDFRGAGGPRSKSEVVENRPKFYIFLRGVPPPEFLDLIYLIPQVSDHVAKFHGDRSRDGEEKLAKVIKKLDGHGKARREAARRHNSECKINLSCRNSSRGNGSRPTAHR